MASRWSTPMRKKLASDTKKQTGSIGSTNLCMSSIAEMQCVSERAFADSHERGQMFTLRLPQSARQQYRCCISAMKQKRESSSRELLDTRAENVGRMNSYSVSLNVAFNSARAAERFWSQLVRLKEQMQNLPGLHAFGATFSRKRVQRKRKQLQTAVN